MKIEYANWVSSCIFTMRLWRESIQGSHPALGSVYTDLLAKAVIAKNGNSTHFSVLLTLCSVWKDHSAKKGMHCVCAGADPGFGQGGGPASDAESCWWSEAKSCERSEQSAAGVQGPLKGPGSFWVFNAQICILTHSRDSFSLIFDIYFDTQKLIKIEH